MTDRHAGYIVTLERDIHEYDAQATITALRQIRGVLSVEPIVADADHYVAYSRAMYSMREKLWEFIKDWKP